MRIFLILLIMINPLDSAFAIDLKSLGEDLKKGLDGTLKQIEKELDQGIDGDSSSSSGDSNIGQASAQIIDGLCTITYVASDGSEYIKQSTHQDCDEVKRYFLLNEAKKIERTLQQNQQMQDRQLEEANRQADLIEKERASTQAAKEEKLKEVRAKQAEIMANSIPRKLKPRDANTRKLTKDYTDEQRIFLSDFWEYRGLMSKYYQSKFDPDVSERQGDKALKLAYDKFVLKFYKDEGVRQERGGGNALRENPFPLSALHFSQSDNFGQSVNEWKCYVMPKSSDTGIQPICYIFWETINRGERVMVSTPVQVDMWGYGDFHESVLAKNPKRYVGDQLSITAKDLWLFGDVMGANNELGWDSTLSYIVLIEPTWTISIEDAIKYDTNSRKWVFR